MADEPIYKLASGATSRFYFNMKPTAHSPEGLTLIGGLYLDKMDELGIRPDAIGGLTMGADPIAAAVAMTSFARKPPVEAFVIRKEPKKYGMTLQLEGHVKAGDSVVIVDDVVTTGGSTIKAINVAKECGVHILAVIVLLDRCEQNGMENVSAQGCPAYSILNIHDFM
ncbi:MAG: orotate phosphoribosyltransferase [Nitrospirae bacterium]|nr:orotate phosphoribosyltransferase [Nitrospirota bacterium]